jgi:excisionase family DNA binding protein
MTIYRLAHSGGLPFLRIGRSITIPEAALQAYLDNVA